MDGGGVPSAGHNAAREAAAAMSPSLSRPRARRAARTALSPPPEREWKQWPVLVTQQQGATGAHKPVEVHTTHTHPCKSEAGHVHSVSSDDFQGQCRIILRVPDTGEPGERDELAHRYFDGRKRQVGILLRGTFKRKVRFADVMVGHKFERAIRQPGTWRARMIVAAIRKLLPHYRLNFGDAPKFLAPVAVDCKRMHVRELTPREMGSPFFHSVLPPIDAVEEDTKLLGGFFEGNERTSERRRRFFKCRKELDSFTFKPGYEYTLEFFQHSCSFVTYEMSYGLGHFDMGYVLQGQPFQFRIEVEGKDMCHFKFWSSELLQHAPGAVGKTSARSKGHGSGRKGVRGREPSEGEPAVQRRDSQDGRLDDFHDSLENWSGSEGEEEPPFGNIFIRL